MVIFVSRPLYLTRKYDLEFEVDPLFSRTSAKFDESGVNGLLINNIPIN